LIKREPFWVRYRISFSRVVEIGQSDTKYIRLPKRLAVQLAEKLGRDPWDEDCLVGLEETGNSVKFYVLFPKNGIDRKEIMEEVRERCASSRALGQYL
jgi:hypothetical protein